MLPILAVTIKIPKNGKNLLQASALPSGPTPKNLRPRAKIRMPKPQNGENFRCKSLGVRVGGGVVMAKIDSCINLVQCVLKHARTRLTILTQQQKQSQDKNNWNFVVASWQSVFGLAKFNHF